MVTLEFVWNVWLLWYILYLCMTFGIFVMINSKSLFTFHSTLHPSWLPSASLFHPPVCIVFSLCSLCSWPYGWVGLKGRVCGFAHHFPWQHRTRTQRASNFCLSPAIFAIVSDRDSCSSAPLPSPYPRCGRDHKPNGPFRLRAVVITDPSLRPLFINPRCH